MKLNSVRIGSALAVAAVALSGAVAVAPASSAATIGGLVVPSGTGASLFNVKTSAPCPAGATNFRASISSTNPGWTPGRVLVGNTAIATFGDLVNSGAPIANSLDAIATAAGTTFSAGTYNVVGECINSLGTTLFGSYDAVLTVTGAAATGNAFTAVQAGAPASTTTLAVTPASPVNLGANVTMTATVAAGVAVSGTVDFFDGATKLNTTPVAVAAGTASFSTTALAGGVRSLTAQFTPAAGVFLAGSTSAATSFTVTAPAAATTTTLAATAGTTVDPVVLSAAVAPAGAAGSVDFFEGATKVGSSAVSNGVATLSLVGVAAGAHSYTATFVPANVALFLGSSSAAASATVTAFAGYTLPGGENITTTIGAGGTLTLTAATTLVDLGAATLNTAGNLFVTAPKAMNDVTVSDTRAGSLGYTVSGTAGDFVSTITATNKINSENLGWAPRLVSNSAAVSATAGTAVAAGNGVAVGAVSNPVAGLKAVRTLGSAAAGASVGQAVFGADLTLQAPTTTAAGVYNTTLVITAI
jgi:hypothetical protein